MPGIIPIEVGAYIHMIKGNKLHSFSSAGEGAFNPLELLLSALWVVSLQIFNFVED